MEARCPAIAFGASSLSLICIVWRFDEPVQQLIGEQRWAAGRQRVHSNLATAHTILTVTTRGKGLYVFTGPVQKWLGSQAIRDGVLTVFVQHTSCSLVIQENADPDVTLDMRDFFERLVPEDGEGFRHTLEGPDDMTSHIRSALTQTSLSIPLLDGELGLGTWQGLYVFEHRRQPHQRRVVLQLMGDA